VFLVTGWRGDELVAGIESRDITVVKNPAYESGMFSSVRAAAERLLPSHRAFFIMPVDIPLVRTATVERLLSVAGEQPDRILYPVFGGVRGHPPLIPASLVPAILDWRGNGGLDAVLGSRPEMDLEVPVPDENILLDVDNQEAFSALLERYRRYEIPTEAECDAILEIAGTAENIRRHCRKVADVAVAVAGALVTSGIGVDIEAVRAASLLHDVAKGEPHHDTAGGRVLRNYGFGAIGDIIAVHTNIGSGDTRPSIEAKIVFLADKFVRDEETVTIEERYRSAGEKYGHILGVEEKIGRWQSEALEVKEELEGLLGSSLDDIVFR
jgi:putative nucleotidyltransferase with HDIG domain